MNQSEASPPPDETVPQGESHPDSAPSSGGLSPDPARVAVISLHTSPTDQPGMGDSGGMNVYILSVAERLAEQGIAVDMFTRCHGQGGPEVEEISPLSRVIRVKAGPCAPVQKKDLPGLLPEFLDGVVQYASAEEGWDRHSPYDV